MTDAARTDAVLPPEAARAGAPIYRHRLVTRAWHWINALAIFTLLGSGATISNAHPHLYWGQYGANPDHPWLNVVHFPAWVTIPSGYNLALARHWHLLFALVLAFGLLGYMAISILNRHFGNDLRVRARDLAPGAVWHDIREHLALRFHDPEHPRDYNILQKLAYVLAIFILIPLMILTGLALSPGMDAAWPWMLDLLGGRATARSLHFIAAGGIAAFVVVHLTLVILAGVGQELRSIVTGWWQPPEETR